MSNKVLKDSVRASFFSLYPCNMRAALGWRHPMLCSKSQGCCESMPSQLLPTIKWRSNALWCLIVFEIWSLHLIFTVAGCILPGHFFFSIDVVLSSQGQQQSHVQRKETSWRLSCISVPSASCPAGLQYWITGSSWNAWKAIQLGLKVAWRYSPSLSGSIYSKLEDTFHFNKWKWILRNTCSNQLGKKGSASPHNFFIGVLRSVAAGLSKTSFHLSSSQTEIMHNWGTLAWDNQYSFASPKNHEAATKPWQLYYTWWKKQSHTSINNSTYMLNKILHVSCQIVQVALLCVQTSFWPQKTSSHSASTESWIIVLDIGNTSFEDFTWPRSQVQILATTEQTLYNYNMSWPMWLVQVGIETLPMALHP